MTQITDHFPQFLIVKHAGITYKNLSYFQHDFSNLSEENLQNDFVNLDLNYLTDNAIDVNAKFNIFLSSLDEFVGITFPLLYKVHHLLVAFVKNSNPSSLKIIAKLTPLFTR